MQKAYRRYRQKKDPNPPVESTRSAKATTLNNLHQKVFDEVVARADIPIEFDNREDSTEADDEQRAFTDRLMRALLAEEGGDFYFAKQCFKCERKGEINYINLKKL